MTTSRLGTTLRTIALLSLLVSATELGAQRRDIRVTLRGHPKVVLLDTLARWTDTLPVAAAATYISALHVLDSLEMDHTESDPSNGLIVNRGFTRRGMLAGRRLSWAFLCGTGLPGQNADAYRLYITFAAFVDSVPGNRSRFGIGAIAGAEDNQGSVLRCGSTGALEAKVVELVQRRVHGSVGGPSR